MAACSRAPEAPAILLYHPRSKSNVTSDRQIRRRLSGRPGLQRRRLCRYQGRDYFICTIVGSPTVSFGRIRRHDNDFGGLIASGWHVALIMMRLMLRGGIISPETSLESPGHEGLKWLLPVRPGDCLSGTVTITGIRISRSRPEIGLIASVASLRNQSDQEVYWLQSTAIIKSRMSS